MKDIFEEIVANKRKEVEEFKQFIPPVQLYKLVGEKMADKGLSMREALLCSDSGIIAEFKRRSPSKGWINEEAKADVVPLDYQKNGASAVSILTDRNFFGGYNEHIQMARASGVTLPILYKNFVIDEYQLFQARYCGASAVLLIATCLSESECRTMIKVAHEIGLEVLLELHGQKEIDYVELEADMVGVNNRDLGTFHTHVENSYKMAELLPKDLCKVSESGISSPEIISHLRGIGYHGFLIGECLMKAEQPGNKLKLLIESL